MANGNGGARSWVLSMIMAVIAAASLTFGITSRIEAGDASKTARSNEGRIIRLETQYVMILDYLKKIDGKMDAHVGDD